LDSDIFELSAFLDFKVLFNLPLLCLFFQENTVAHLNSATVSALRKRPDMKISRTKKLLVNLPSEALQKRPDMQMARTEKVIVNMPSGVKYSENCMRLAVSKVVVAFQILVFVSCSGIMDRNEVMDLSDIEEDGDDVTATEFDSYPRTEELECM
jgi:hypothetical protein